MWWYQLTYPTYLCAVLLWSANHNFEANEITYLNQLKEQGNDYHHRLVSVTLYYLQIKVLTTWEILLNPFYSHLYSALKNICLVFYYACYSKFVKVLHRLWTRYLKNGLLKCKNIRTTKNPLSRATVQSFLTVCDLVERNHSLRSPLYFASA